jgi:hypothetical protein
MRYPAKPRITGLPPTLREVRAQSPTIVSPVVVGEFFDELRREKF